MPSPSRFVDGVVVDGIWMRKGWMMGTADVDRFSYRFRRPFEDGGHVDACVKLSGSRWLYVSTSTALAGIRRLVAGVLANMDSAFGRL